MKIRSHILKLLSLGIVLLFLSSIVKATTYYSAGNNSPNTISNWWTGTNGTGSHPSNFTTSGNVFVIQSGHTMTTTNTWKVSGTGSTVRIYGTLVASSAVSSTVMMVYSGGTYQHAMNAGTIPTATWDVASTCLITGTKRTLPSGRNQHFGNLIWNCTGQTATTAYGTFFINGDLTIQSTGSTGQFTFSDGSENTVGGSYFQSGGTVRLASGTATSLTVAGGFSMSGGTFTASDWFGEVGTLNIAGDFSLTSGTITELGNGSGNINFNGLGLQTYLKSGGTFSNTINFAVNNGSILDVGTSLIDGSSGTFTLNSGAGIITAHAQGLSTTAGTGSIQVTGTKTYDTGANYTYDGTVNQLTGNGLTGANNLTLSNAGGATLSTSVVVNGVLTLTNGKLTTSGTKLLSVANSATTAISGGSATSFINGPVRWTMPASLGSGVTYNFPVGKGTSYLPFTLVNPTTGTGTVTVRVESFASGSGGTYDGTLASVSSTEYWSMTTSGNFTGSSVSLSRPSSISPLDVIAGSSSSGGVYTCLEGTAGSNGVSGSDAIGSYRFFALAARKSIITTMPITGAPFCAGTSGVSVPFTYTPKAKFASATFTAQLSNASGSFTAPVTLESVVSNGTGSQSLNVTIPSGTSPGTGYRIRIVSNNPAVIGSDNGTDITISSGAPSQPGSISGSANPCANTAGVTYSVPNVSGVTYTWSFPAGWTQTAGGNTSSVTVTTGSDSGNIQVKPSNSCGDGMAQTLAVEVVAGPVITVQPSITPQGVCQGSATATLSVSATGTGLSYQWYKNTTAANSGGTLLSGATSSGYTPPSSSIGTSYYYCVVTGTCAPAATSEVSGAVSIVVPQALTAVPGSRCGTGTVNLSVTTSSCISSTVSWFAASTGGTSLGTGASFTTPSISSTTTYYAQENFTGGLATVGSGTSATNNVGLVFDLNEQIVLNSVQIKPSATGTITIALQDNTGTVISSVSPTLSSTATQTVNLGWSIPAGTGYRLVKTAGTMALSRTDSYMSWPVGFNVGSITSSIESGTINSARYDFFYNWSISRARVGVTATIGSPSVTGFSGSRCGPGIVVLGASASAGTISWFTTLTGGSPVATGPSYSPNLSSTTTFYVWSTDGSCTSSPRIPVVASIITPPSVTASGGGTFCAGSDISLTSTGNNLSNIYWTGPNSFYSLLQNPPTLTNVTPAMSGTYTVTGSALSNVNLISNGDFESGNTAFGSAYIFNGTSVWDEGTYAVVDDPHSVHANFVSDGDHTSGSGMQMVVNGASVANVNIWSQTVNVVPNTDYQYTYWIQSVVEGNPSQLQLYINGVPAGPVYTADVAVNSWRQFTYNWNSGSSTTAYLSLVNQNITPDGNDFALDDIVFQQICEASASVVVTVNNEVTAGSIGTTQTICPGYSPATLASTTAGTGSGTISYEWQTNAGGSYVTIDGATSADYSPPPLTSTTSYRRRTVSQSGGITCYSPYTTEVTITVTAGPTAVAGGPDTVCQSSSPSPITLTGASVGGSATTGAWSIVSGGGSLSDYSQTANPASITYTPAVDYSGPVILRLTSNNTGCAAVSDRTINITPTVGIPTAISIAAGAEPSCQLTNSTTSTTYATTATDNTGFTWSLSNSAAGSIGATTGIMTWANGFSGSVDIQVTANGCNGPSPQTIRNVIITPTVGTPVFDLGSTSNRCQGAEAVNYTATATNSTGITYTLDASSLAAENTIDSSTGEVTYSADWTGTSTITVSAIGCNGPKTAAHIVTTIQDGLWTGTVDDDWNNPANWACGQLPSLTTNVLIGNGKAHYPKVSNADATCKDLTIQSASSVTVSGNTLQIAGVISNNGSFTSSAGIIEMEGSNAQTIPAGTFTGNSIMDLNVDNSSGVTLDGPLKVTGSVRPISGTLNSKGNLTLVSTASQTALIDGEGSGDVSGTVIMQRYLPASFGYKYFSSPFQNATVGQFSEFVNLGASFPTFYGYDENNKSSSGEAISGWVKYVNSSGALIPTHGYSANLGTVATPVTVFLGGTVNNGTLIPLTLTNHNMTYTTGFNLIGNPYPSPIDWDSPNWIRTNVDGAIYFFSASAPGADANANDSLQYQGTYSSYIKGYSTGGPTNIIPSMQAFFVHVSSLSPVNGSITFNNGIRVNELKPAFKSAFFTSTPQLRLSAAFDGNFSDPAVLYFDEAATSSFDEKLDALKMMNTDYRIPNLYFKSADSKDLSISAIPFPVDSITGIPIGLKLARNGKINFEALTLDQIPAGYRVYLKDALKGSYKELRLNDPYTVFLNAGSYENRFSLVFSSSELQSVTPTEGTEKFTIIPTGGIWVVNLKLGTDETGILQLVNMKGQVLLRREVHGNESVELDYKGNSGVYIVSLVSGNRVYSKKIIIQKQ